ncbi:MAG: hypothetical protein SF052_01370 [Bacteroidia bacterium]|nr:hypothetical protein [Bacteroidia bacterium]
MELSLLQLVILGSILLIVILGVVFIINDNRAYKREMKERAKAGKPDSRKKETEFV